MDKSCGLVHAEIIAEPLWCIQKNILTSLRNAFNSSLISLYLYPNGYFY